jgi:hypothetical protein
MDLNTSELPYPGVWLSDLSLLTFAEVSDFSSYLSPLYFIDKTRQIQTDDFISKKDALRDGPKYLAQLLRLAWDSFLQQKLPRNEAATGRFSYYFKKDLLPDDTAFFIGANGKKAHRNLVGYKTMLGGKVRYWHYALSGKPVIRPETLFLIKGHVVFSDDGFSLWTNKDQTAKARRNQCKNWWNDEWRDRMYATISFLAQGNEQVILPLGANTAFSLSRQPILFESPVSYLEPGEVLKEEDLEDYEAEEDDSNTEEIQDEIPGDITE